MRSISARVLHVILEVLVDGPRVVDASFTSVVTPGHSWLTLCLRGDGVVGGGVGGWYTPVVDGHVVSLASIVEREYSTKY